MDSLDKMRDCPYFTPCVRRLYADTQVMHTEVYCSNETMCANLTLRFFGSAIPFCLREWGDQNAVDSGGVGGDAPGR